MKKIEMNEGGPVFPRLTKLWRVMKITCLFLMVALVQVSASAYSQNTRLTLNKESTSLAALIEEVEKNSEFRFFYDSKQIDLSAEVTVKARRSNIDQILEQVFANSDVSYEIIDRHIILKGKSTDTPGAVIVAGQQQQNSVSGKVTDNRNQPLPGGTVVIKGTTQGTITNSDGVYSISNVPPNSTLVFSFVGMKTEEVAVGTQNTINVSMNEDAIGIEEVVAIGYGTQKKENLTGSITMVEADEMARIPMPSIAQTLMGRSPGVFIKNVGGQAGKEDVRINIRGYGTPLIVVDGMPVSVAYFQQIEPGDIESFNVLKDASAAAVYGARAGNGVILVTTKRGTESAPRFSYTGNFGQQFLMTVEDRVNSAQYASMYNVGLTNYGKAPRWSEEEVQLFRDESDPVNYPNTDWLKETLKDFAPQQQHTFNVMGGTETIKYFTSINYFNQKGMHTSDDTDYKRFTLRSNIDIQLAKKLNLGFDLSMTNQSYIGPSIGFGDIMTRIWRSRPFALNQPLPDPTKVPAMLGGLTVNPYYMGIIEHVGFNEYDKLHGFAKLRFEYELPFGFGVKAIFDINRLTDREKTRVLEMPMYDYNPETDTYTERRRQNQFDFLREENRIANNINQQYFLTWEGQFDKHQLNALFVHEQLSDNFDYLMAYRRDFDFNLNYLFAGPDVNKDNTGYANEGGRKAFIGRINYNYMGKYLFELSSRWDGSPKFPEDTRWGFFPSASLGWRLSEEPFIQTALPFISNLKIRASHGMLGYDAAGSFQYLSTYSIRSRYLDAKDGLMPGIRTDAIPNPNITWETMISSNIGIDFNLWDGKLLEGSLDYFYRLRKDVLGTRFSSIPNVVGATLPQENFWEYDNRGWEFVLSHAHKIGSVDYNIGFNISTNREKTVFRDQTDFATREAYRRGNQNGEWTDRFWVLPTDGLFHSQEEIDNWAIIDGQGNRTIRLGDIKYIDYNNDGRIDADDMIVAGRGYMPRLMYGVDLALSWKGFDFMMLWQGAGLFNYYLDHNFILPFVAENAPIKYQYYNNYTPENLWMPSNTTNAKWPRYGTDADNRNHTNFKSPIGGIFSNHTEFWLFSGNYLRLKNIQVGYTIPESISNRWGIDELRVFIGGYNLYTFHKRDFIDPEFSTATNGRTTENFDPVLGNYTFGVKINF